MLVDDHSRYTWAYFLTNKSEALACFTYWMDEIVPFTERKVKPICSNDPGEYTGRELEGHFACS